MRPARRSSTPLIWAASGDDDGFGIAVDASGNAYVTGNTASSDFPTTAGAYQTVYGGGLRRFRDQAQCDRHGARLLHLSGRQRVDDYGYGIAVDASGNVYVTGNTASSNFPTTAGAYQTVYGGGGYDAFVTKLNATGTCARLLHLSGRKRRG